MKIEVFGPGCHRCHQVEESVKNALTELNVSGDIEKVNDMSKMVEVEGYLMFDSEALLPEKITYNGTEIPLGNPMG